MNFNNQHVVITGGSTGIGYATARKIVDLGGRVSLIARRQSVLDEAVAELGAAARGYAADVGDKVALTGAIDRAITASGPIDGLFLNAATEGMYGPTPDYTDEAFERVMRVNVTSVFQAVRYVLPAMITRGKGAILMTGSLASETGMVGNIGYLASKHAVLGIARGLAMEVAASGIRVNCVNPGVIDTPMLAETPGDFRVAMAERIPQGRLGRAEEAAAVAAFLLSDEASHVTAQSWAVDGGLLGTLKI